MDMLPKYKKWAGGDRGSFWWRDHKASEPFNIAVRWSQFSKKPKDVTTHWSGGFQHTTQPGLLGASHPKFHGVMQSDTQHGALFITLQHDEVRRTRAKLLLELVKGAEAWGAKHSMLFGGGLYNHKVLYSSPQHGTGESTFPECSFGCEYTGALPGWATLQHHCTLRHENSVAQYTPFIHQQGEQFDDVAVNIPRADFAKIELEPASKGVRITGLGGANVAGLRPGMIMSALRENPPEQSERPSPGKPPLRKVTCVGEVLRALAEARGDREIRAQFQQTISGTGFWSSVTHMSATRVVLGQPWLPGLTCGAEFKTMGAALQKWSAGVKYDCGKGNSMACANVSGKPGKFRGMSVDAFSPTLTMEGHAVRAGATVLVSPGFNGVDREGTVVGIAASDAQGIAAGSMRTGTGSWHEQMGVKVKAALTGGMNAAVHWTQPPGPQSPTQVRISLSAHLPQKGAGGLKLGLSCDTHGTEYQQDEAMSAVEDMLQMNHGDTSDHKAG